MNFDFSIIDDAISNFDDILGVEKKVTPQKTFELYPVQKEWVDWAFLGGERLLLGARRYGKTETIVFEGLYQEILKNPQTTARLYTRNFDSARDMLRVVASKLIDSGFNGKFNDYFIVLDEARKIKEPTLSLKSILGRGHKGVHVDWVIMDDPVDLMDEFSPTLLKRVKKIYENLSSIAKKGVIIVGQPVCENDLYEQLRQTIPTREYWYGSIPELDQDIDELRKSKSERYIQANYFGKIISAEKLPFFNIKPSDADPEGFIYGCIDPSLEGKDYTALAYAWKSGDSIVFGGVIEKVDYMTFIETHREELLNIDYLYYERNSTGGAMEKILYQNGLSGTGFRSTVNKSFKIRCMIPLIKNGYLRYYVKSQPEFIDQVKNWNEDAKHDDAPDSLSMLIKEVFNL